MQGKQAPPGKLIDNLARDPRVSLAWLFRGEGSPTDAEPGQGIVTPICRQILPGPPEEQQDYLSGETYALSPRHYKPSRYWLEIQSGDPVLRSGLHLNARDLLLMECDHRFFPSRERLGQQLCGVKIGGIMKLGLIDYVEGDDESGPSRLEADTFDLGVDLSEVRREVVTVMIRGRPRKNEILYRWVQGKAGKKVKREVSDFELEPILPTVAYDDIVCVSVLLVRRNPNAT